MASTEVVKLDTYEGVFIPTTLNVLSILIYLRFGFIVGQAGILGSVVLLLVSYSINLLTTMSVSAIATNGVVKGGGAYYMISRSLGPEFGGSIGIVFFIGQVLNAGLNVAGFADPLLAKFGQTNGTFSRSLPDSPAWAFGYQTMLLLLCTVICLLGPQLFASSSKLLFKILLLATLAVPASTFFVHKFYDSEFDAWYTGPQWSTFKDNFLPRFTQGAAGSDLDTKENFRDLFGISFSATAGILAGASMSGDLQNPSKSIPRGTLWGLLVTFLLYSSVIFAIGSSVSRDMLYRDIDVISNVDLSPALVTVGEFATSIFSALMGVLGAAKLLQAIARDNVVPFISKFGFGYGADDNPIPAILFTYFLTQLTILLDVNQIAVYITMAFLMTFLVLNLACFLLDVAAAPNFRPSFRYFDDQTAFLGFAVCIAAMAITDYFAASSIILLTLILFVVIHAYSPPKPWGDVSQSIIYHQTRKYLLKLKQNHVKYWRPQILLFVDDPRSCWQLIRFCNYLKKGGLYVLGHVVILDNKTDFHADAEEIAVQRSAWEKLRDLHHIKAFFQISASNSIVWGARNVFLGSGLGGMRPNISVLGFYDLDHSGRTRRDHIDVESLPTDHLRHESHCSLTEWVQIIEDLLTLGSNVCITKGFMDIDLPAPKPLFKWPFSKESKKSTKVPPENRSYIDLYPIQMSARITDIDGSANGVSINFDTYTLILQLGSILHSVKAWSAEHALRVVAFVEKEEEVERETFRITGLLDSLRIDAEVKVVPLDCNNNVYNVIVKGDKDADDFVDNKLKESTWYQNLRRARLSEQKDGSLKFPHREKQSTYVVPQMIGQRKRTLSSLQKLGVAHSIQSTQWFPEHIGSIYEDDEDDHDHRRQSAVSDDDDSPPAPISTESSSEPDAAVKSSDDSDAIAEDDVGADDEDDVEHHDEAGPSFQDDPMDASQLGSPINNESSIAGRTNPPHYARQSQSPQPHTTKMSKKNRSNLRFNDLPASSQHLILNCLMRNVSAEATVIFTTLPPPAMGTHTDETLSKKYHRLLQILCDDLPPVALVNAQSMTVTTSL